jgi:hypothetical protein
MAASSLPLFCFSFGRLFRLADMRKSYSVYPMVDPFAHAVTFITHVSNAKTGGVIVFTSRPKRCPSGACEPKCIATLAFSSYQTTGQQNPCDLHQRALSFSFFHAQGSWHMRQSRGCSRGTPTDVLWYTPTSSWSCNPMRN